MRLFVVNVGVNTSDGARRGLRSPIFADSAFEFVPIKERRDFSDCPGIPRYCDLPSYTGQFESLAAFLPRRISRYRAHGDPEFETFTYGDVCSSRAANLKYVEPGDELWFLARLWHYDKQRWTGDSGFYFIARFEVETNSLIPANTDSENVQAKIRQRIRANAHYKRWILAGDRNTFRVIAGSHARSSRFRRALKVTPQVAGNIYGGVY